MSSNPFLQELIERKSKALRAVPFGISYLDDAIGGIRPTDLVVITAKTGVGKTEILASIALETAAKGKKIFFYALEAERYEIERRLSYRILSKRFFEERSKYPGHIHLNYTDWVLDRFPELDDLNERVAMEMPSLTEGIQFFTPELANFTKEDFTMIYQEACEEADIMFVDHLHYFTRPERMNEYDHVQKIVYELRDLINKKEVPLVCAAHIRKEDRHNPTLLPTLEEIHGASEISKQANHVISLGPCYTLPSKSDPEVRLPQPIGSTLARVLKTRWGQSGADRYVALMQFDIETKSYRPHYIPYRVDRFCEKIEAIGIRDFERWMGNAREPNL